SALVEMLYALLLAVRGGRLRRLPLLAVAKVLGLVAGAIQFLPTYEMLRDSVRQKPTREVLAVGSLYPAHPLQLVAPYPFHARVVSGGEGLMIETHEYGLYCGAAATVLWVWLLVRLPQLGERRPLALAAVALAGLSLVLSFGAYTGLFEVTHRLPV